MSVVRLLSFVILQQGDFVSRENSIKRQIVCIRKVFSLFEFYDALSLIVQLEPPDYKDTQKQSFGQKEFFVEILVNGP